MVDIQQMAVYIRHMKIEKDNIGMQFSYALYEIMETHKLNQLALANLIGVRQSQVSNWLYRKSLPGYLSLCSIIEKLNVEPHKLFETPVL
jgi:transcriptional regulator with XRE-family HTH domain